MQNLNHYPGYQNQDRIDPIAVQQFLDGVSFPASKAEVIQAVKQNGGTEAMLKTLSQLSDQEFQNPVEISLAIDQLINDV